ncbi:hypothetical protein DW352_01500 [Pseudolabrys taiwanensis]|uniref:Uncharacterized protein n=1 Tax=Pseudolabrys taiwanensis TaxID=331696 RepID=A0A345ZQV8_9HYPH|nr:hypothetical protein [Pseudolabrys taiwanensis]AXK79305.1 hypothetical protein DW352_01500 [Pseudolabrys taiwanensis]
MRKFSGASTAIVIAIALYFTLVWGYDAVRVLTSPNYGLDEVWRSEYVFIVGRMLGLDPVGLLKVAAFFGAVKLVVAGACAWHIVDRVRALIRGTADADVLEGALIIIVAIGIMSAGLAARSGNGEIVREYAIQLVLACLATALCIAERSKTYSVSEVDNAESESETGAYSGPAIHP